MTCEHADLVAEIAAGVVAQMAAIDRGDARGGNRIARQRDRAWEQLRAAGAAGREALTVLFVHENAHVRVEAAASLLRYCEDRATRVLEAEAVRGGLAGFEAEHALARWREGTWALDPPDEG